MSVAVTGQRQSLRTPKPSAKLRSPSSMASTTTGQGASEAQNSATKAGNTAAAASNTSGNTSTNNASTAASVKTEGKTDTSKETSNAAAQPLAPPPKPSAVAALSNAAGSTNTPDYFNSVHNNGSTYSLEPNLFEASFVGGPGETPGKSLLPPVASLTSPSPLTGRESLTGFNWGGGASLRSGPLSPAMLSGPMGSMGSGDYFDTQHMRAAFPTPNESSLRTGLTPGGGGSMFPQPSPNTASFLNSLGSATPSTLDFQRTALNANHNKNKLDALSTVAMSQPQNQNGGLAPRTSAPQEPAPDHTQAANGLFLLAQAGNRERNNNGAPADNKPQSGVTTIANAAQRISNPTPAKQEDDSKNGRGKSAAKKTTPAKGGKGGRKSEDLKGQPKKRQRTASMSMGEEDDDDDDGGDMDVDDDKVGPDGKKPTDEEKRKNFLERNRVAALKCRQRKKQWLANLQAKVEMFSSDNDMLTQQNQQLKEEILNLKTILIAHKDCPIAQQQQQAGQYISTHANDSYMQHGHPHAGPYPANVMGMNMGVAGVGAPGQSGGMMGGMRRPS